MKRFKKTYVLPALFLFVLGTALGFQLESAVSNTDTMDQLRKLEEAFLTINKRYVEDVDAEKLADHAIKSMLEELDPHSSFISVKDLKEVQDSYRGSFGGIGVWFEIIEDTARVVTPIEGGPSEKLGIRAGDRIIEINDSTATWEGLENDYITKNLKGPIGTTVDVTLKRLGVERLSTGLGVKRLRSVLSRPTFSGPVDCADLVNSFQTTASTRIFRRRT